MNENCGGFEISYEIGEGIDKVMERRMREGGWWIRFVKKGYYKKRREGCMNDLCYFITNSERTKYV